MCLEDNAQKMCIKQDCKIHTHAKKSVLDSNLLEERVFIGTKIEVPDSVFETRRSRPVFTSSETEKSDKMCSRNIVVQISHQLLDQFLIPGNRSKLNISEILILITDFKM